MQVGDSPSLGHFIALRDAYGNTYVYAQLGEVSSVYPVLEPHVHSAPSPRIARHNAQASNQRRRGPRRPARSRARRSARARPSRGSRSARRQDWNRPRPACPRPPPSTAAPACPVRARSTAHLQVFSEGANDVYLHPLVAGVQVIAGTVLGHVGAVTGPAGARRRPPHILFQIRPGRGGRAADRPQADPRRLGGARRTPRSSGPRARTRSSRPRRRSARCCSSQSSSSSRRCCTTAASSSVAADARTCRRDGSTSACWRCSSTCPSRAWSRPSRGCRAPRRPRRRSPPTPPASASGETVEITAVNGIPIAGHQGTGSIADDDRAQAADARRASRGRGGSSA